MNKKGLFLGLLMSVMTLSVKAQNVGDTIVVTAIDYNSLTRDTVVQFPDLPGVTFEKVLMKYNMRCHGGAVNTTGGNNWGPNGSNGCGEWDYSCNSYIHDSTRIDSILQQHPSHTISGFTGTAYNYTTQPTYTYYEHSQQDVTINSTTSETVGTLNAGTTALNDVMSVQHESGKSQYLLTATELTAAGLTAGDITGLRLNILGGSSLAEYFRIRVKSTTSTSLDLTNVDLTGFTEVYYQNYTAAVGTEQFQFYAPFNWDGTSNVIVEFTFTGDTGLPVIDVEGGAAPATSVLTNQTTDRFAKLEGSGQYVDLPDATHDFSNGFTVAGWVRYNSFENWSRILDMGNGPGADNILLANQGTTNNLVLSVRIGNSATDLNASGVLNAGEWMHVAATVDASGNGTLYVNGQSVQSGTVNVPLSIERTNNYIGRSNWSNDAYFDGDLDELVMWNVPLSQTEIQDWMYQDIDATHPNFSNILFGYNFNDGNAVTATDISGNSSNGTLMGYTGTPLFDGRDIFKNLAETNDRPNIDLLQGVYNQTVTTVAVMDSVQNVPNVVTEYAVTANPGVIMDDSVDPISTNNYWQAINQSVYNAETGALLSIIPVTTEGSITPTELDYYQRYPMKFEIMSFVTPYGINLNMGIDGKTWTFDMTDFTPILNGDRRLTIEKSGRWQEEMDIKFLFIVGTPPADVLDIRQVWRNQTRGYVSIMNDEYFAPRDLETDPNGESFKVRSAITGHGQEGEFIPQTHHVDINGGANEFIWQVWKECGENPVYPQGGTWIYDRAGWCPGMATDIQHWDITPFVTAGQSVNIDYGIQNGQGTSNYIVNHQLVTYGEANHALDASVVEVKQPSTRVEYDRYNEICQDPIITIKNTGSTTLTSLTINYWVNDASIPETYEWTGGLEFMDEAEVHLPSPLWLWNTANPSDNVFHVEISAPNGGTDEYEHNNTYASSFDIPEVMPSDLIVWFRTNNAPGESSYQITDADGNIVHERSNMSAATLYRDTLELGIGCYQYRVFDTDDDGINFWANNDGNGYTRFNQVGGGVVKNFNPDFGDGIIYNFTVNFPLSYEELAAINSIDVYPNPTEDELNIELNGYDNEVTLLLYNSAGQLVKNEVVTTISGTYNGSMSLSDLANGVYILKVTDGNKSTRAKVIKE